MTGWEYTQYLREKTFLDTETRIEELNAEARWVRQLSGGIFSADIEAAISELNIHSEWTQAINREIAWELRVHEVPQRTSP